MTSVTPIIISDTHHQTSSLALDASQICSHGTNLFLLSWHTNQNGERDMENG